MIRIISSLVHSDEDSEEEVAKSMKIKLLRKKEDGEKNTKSLNALDIMEAAHRTDLLKTKQIKSCKAEIDKKYGHIAYLTIKSSDSAAITIEEIPSFRKELLKNLNS